MFRPEEYGKVVVLYGGSSSERDVSLESGAAVIRVLQELGLRVIPVDAKGDFLSKLLSLRDEKVSRIFNCLHGGDGEDGTIQGALTLSGIPFTGSGVAASSLAMDKAVCKGVWKSLGIRTLDYAEVDSLDAAISSATTMGYPIAVKPISEGSSVGVSKVDNLSELEKAFEQASLKGRVMLEPWQSGAEYSVTILNGVALPVVEVIYPAGKFYDYALKYESDETDYRFGTLSKEREEYMQDLACKAYKTIGCESCARVDVISNVETGEFYVLEINTLPGLTSHSLVPKCAERVGKNFGQLILDILDTTMPERGRAYIPKKESKRPRVGGFSQSLW